MLSCAWPCAMPSKCRGSDACVHFIVPPRLADDVVSVTFVRSFDSVGAEVELLLLLELEPPLSDPPQAARNAAPAAVAPVAMTARRRVIRCCNTLAQ